MSNQFNAYSAAAVGPLSGVFHTSAPLALDTVPRRGEKLNDLVREWIALTPTQNTHTFGVASANGSQCTFRPDNFDRPLIYYVRVVISAITATGGTYARLKDSALLSIIKNLDYRYINQSVNTPLMEQQWLEALLEDNVRLQQRRLRKLGLLQTAADRDAAATAQLELYIRLPSYHQREPYKAPFVRGLGTQYEILFNWGPLGEIIETDGTNPVCTIVGQPELVVEHETYTNDTKKAFFALIQQEKGLVAPFLDWQREVVSTSLAAGTLNAGRLAVPPMRREARFLIFLFQDVANFTDYVGSSTALSSALLPDYVTLVYDSKNQLQERVSVKLLQDRFFERHFPDGGEFPCVPFVFEQCSHDRLLTSGSVDLNYTPSLTIQPEWNVATPVNLRITVYAATYNIVQQVQANWKKAAV